MEKGDQVNYVPHRCHALDRDIAGDLAWVLGKRTQPHLGDKSSVEELEGKTLNDYLDYIRRSPNPSEEIKNLVFIRPNKHWDAIVREVNEDGTVHLDIQSSNGGVTLHYDNIKVDDKKSHHTCHAR